MSAAVECGAHVFRCSVCDNTVAPSLVRAGKVCPKHPDAEVGDGTCRQPVARNGLKCKTHGFGSPTWQGAERRREAKERARLLLDVEGLDPVTDPLAALAQLAAEVLGVKDVLRRQVEALEALTYEDSIDREEVRALMAAYERALDRSGKLLTDMGRMDLEDKLTRRKQALEAEQGRLITEAFRSVVASPDAGLTTLQQDRLAKMMAARLRGLQAPSSAPAPAALPASAGTE